MVLGNRLSSEILKVKVKQSTGKLVRLALYNNLSILLLENLCYHLWNGKRTQALDARQGQQMEGSEERTSFGLDRTRFQRDLGFGFIGGGRGQHVSRRPASIQCNLFVHLLPLFFLLKDFHRDCWDKSDAVDGIHILITLAAIRRRSFLSRTKNVLLDPSVPGVWSIWVYG